MSTLPPARAWMGLAIIFIGMSLMFMAMNVDDTNELRIRLLFWHSVLVTILGCIAAAYGLKRR